MNQLSSESATEHSHSSYWAEYAIGAILFAQLLAGPLLVLDWLIPATIGIGSFSFSMDFQYLWASLYGTMLSFLVVLPFIFAWAEKSIVLRLIFFLVLLCIAVALFISCAFFDRIVYAFRTSAPLSQSLEELLHLSRATVLFVFGITLTPLAMRAYRRWQLMKEESSSATSSQTSNRLEWICLAAIFATIVFGSSSVGPADGIAMIISMIGVGLGLLISTIAFWMLKESSQATHRSLTIAYLILFVAVPIICIWLADYSPLSILPAGIGLFFVPVIAVAAVLLTHMKLARIAGYRLTQVAVKPRDVRTRNKVIVDPFSD